MFAEVSDVVKQMWKRRNVVRTFDPHRKLQGGAGAMRLRNWQGDVAVIMMYWRVMPKDGSSRAGHVHHVTLTSTIGCALLEMTTKRIRRSRADGLLMERTPRGLAVQRHF